VPIELDFARRSLHESERFQFDRNRIRGGVPSNSAQGVTCLRKVQETPKERAFQPGEPGLFRTNASSCRPAE
jgi:hypothetical protein